jgi:hypothetical protein
MRTDFFCQTHQQVRKVKIHEGHLLLHFPSSYIVRPVHMRARALTCDIRAKVRGVQGEARQGWEMGSFKGSGRKVGTWSREQGQY